MKVRYCNCEEVGIPEDGVVMALLKKNFPGIHWVEKCNHWEKSGINYDMVLSPEEKKWRSKRNV